MALAKKDFGGDLPPFLDPAKHAGDLALILEPRSVRLGTSKYKDPATGQPKATQNVNTMVTVFRTSGSLETGFPSEEGLYTINATVLARDLVEMLEDAKKTGDPAPALIAVLKKVPTKAGNDTWVFRAPVPKDNDLAAKYYELREAKLQAALDDVPPF